MRAERKAGEFLGELKRDSGGRPSKTADSLSGVSEYREVLDEQEIQDGFPFDSAYVPR